MFLQTRSNNILIDQSDGDADHHCSEMHDHRPPLPPTLPAQEQFESAQAGQHENRVGLSSERIYLKEGLKTETPNSLAQESSHALAKQSLENLASTAKKSGQEDEDDQIESEYNYDELSDQLQKALSKIQIKEKGKVHSFLDRVEFFEKKKEKQLKHLREEKQVEQSRYSAKPSLTNAHSEKILQQYEPIQSRYEKILEQKKKKIEKQQSDKRLKLENQIEHQLKQTSKKAENVRSNEQFLSSINSWKEQKQKKIVARAQQQIKSQMIGVTFQPAINTNSKLMVKRMGKVPIYEQQIKAKKIEVDKSCTFQPNLTKAKK